jgi:Uncharacterized protein conserved in bacteria (DUF2199)
LAARINQPPYFGWLQTLVGTYDDTLNIKTIAHEAEVGYIPTIEVTEEDHQLRYDQINGITFETAIAKVEQLLANIHTT